MRARANGNETRGIFTGPLGVGDGARAEAVGEGLIPGGLYTLYVRTCLQSRTHMYARRSGHCRHW